MDPRNNWNKNHTPFEKRGGQYLHAQHDNVTKAEQIIVQKYNKRMFAIGILLAVTIPPLIYRWKRASMAVVVNNVETRRRSN